MSNMSYCRFRNTLADLRDCHQAMDETGGGSPEWDAVSEDEKRARQRLIETCVRIARDYGDFER